MRLSKPLIAAIVTTSVGAAALLGIGIASADDTNPATSLIDRITERFSLNRDDVQAVFDEFHEERQAEHQQKMEEHLQTAVDAGKITAEQRDLILQKMQEVQAQRESFKDLEPEARQEAMKNLHEELKTWAEENNIPAPFGLMGPRHKGPGPDGQMGPRGGANFDGPGLF